MESNNFLKFYLYEYITSYIRDYSRFEDVKLYKQYIAKNTLDYLGIKIHGRWIYSFINIISKFQVLFSSCIVVLYFFKYSIRFIGEKRVKVSGKSVVLDLIGTPELFNKAQFPKQDLVVVRLPYKPRYFDDSFESVDLLSGVPYSVLLNSFRLSIILIFTQYFKYGKRDLLFRNYASYDYFIACHFFSLIDKSNKVVFTSTYDKWAYLFASLNNYKIFVQHGYLARDFYYKSIGSVDECYCLNEEQIDCCRIKLFTNNPSKQFVMNGINFTADNKLINNGKIDVLIIANLLFQEKQEKIIADLFQKTDDRINVYIKPHPLDNKDPYIKLKNVFQDLVILDITDYPKVDVVVSYNSTLAYEYMQVGVPALIYDKAGFGDRFDALCNGIIPQIVL